MNDSVFYAFLSRMKYIGRWALMRNTRTENVLEHSATVAMFAHALAVLHNERGGDVDPDRIGMMALFHETGEVLTGDLPTPVKYFNRDITAAYKDIEKRSEKRLTDSLPETLRTPVSDLVSGGTETERRLVKYADTLAAYVKCVEELAQGNTEFAEAERSTLAKLHSYNSPEVEYFLEHFVRPFGMSLDRLSGGLSGNA